MKYIKPLNYDDKSDELEQNRRAFFEEHNVTKRVSCMSQSGCRRYDKIAYLLEMTSTIRHSFFDHSEIFETSDGHYVGVASPTETDVDVKHYFDSLEGWQVCPGMYSALSPSFFKKIDATTTTDVVFERHMRKLVERNFEQDREAFITEREMDEWLDQGPHHLLHLFQFKVSRKKRALIYVETKDFIKGFTPFMGPMLNATQLTRMLERPLTDSELERIRRQKCWLGWRIRTPSLEIGVETRAVSPCNFHGLDPRRPTVV